MRNETVREITNPAITRWAPVIGVVVGIIFIIFGFTAAAKQRSYVATTAIVSDVFVMPGTGLDDPDRITPTIEYEVDGQTYTATLSEGEKYYEIGDQIAIQYDPSNPQRTIDPNPIGPWLLGGFGILFVVGGGITGWKNRRETASDATAATAS